MWEKKQKLSLFFFEWKNLRAQTKAYVYIKWKKGKIKCEDLMCVWQIPYFNLFISQTPPVSIISENNEGSWLF